MNWPTWEDLVLHLLPVEVYEEISYDMAEIFSAAHRQYPPAREAFSSYSISDLQHRAGEHAVKARSYEPDSPVHQMQQFFSGLSKLLHATFLAIFVIGVVLGSSFWIALSRGLLRTLSSTSEVLLSFVLGGPSALGVFAAVVLLYSQFLTFNPFMIRTINQVLVIGAADINTRNHDELVGIYLWNSSLNGTTGIKLIAIFSALKAVSLIPRVNLYGFVKQGVMNNISVFVESDGFIEATRRVFGRARGQFAETAPERP